MKILAIIAAFFIICGVSLYFLFKSAINIDSENQKVSILGGVVKVDGKNDKVQVFGDTIVVDGKNEKVKVGNLVDIDGKEQIIKVAGGAILVNGNEGETMIEASWVESVEDDKVILKTEKVKEYMKEHSNSLLLKLITSSNDSYTINGKVKEVTDLFVVIESENQEKIKVEVDIDL